MGLWSSGYDVTLTKHKKGKDRWFDSSQAHAMFIKKIFENRIDESVHQKFVRFGKGCFDRRAIIVVTKNNLIKITTSFELANDLVAFIAKLASWFRIQGILLAKKELPELKGKKKGMLWSYEIAQELSSEELAKFAHSCYATLLDCVSPEGKIDLKMKKKLPKPKRSGEIKVDEKFCQLNLATDYWPEFHSEFLWDLPHQLKKARIEHSYIVEEIILPKQQGLNTEQIRQNAKRKGKLIRKMLVDGKEFTKETAFVV